MIYFCSRLDFYLNCFYSRCYGYSVIFYEYIFDCYIGILILSSFYIDWL